MEGFTFHVRRDITPNRRTDCFRDGLTEPCIIAREHSVYISEASVSTPEWEEKGGEYTVGRCQI